MMHPNVDLNLILVLHRVLVEGSVARAAERLHVMARRLSASLPIAVFQPPVAIPPITILQLWHERSDSDPALAFFRAMIREAQRPLQP